MYGILPQRTLGSLHTSMDACKRSSTPEFGRTSWRTCTICLTWVVSSFFISALMQRTMSTLPPCPVVVHDARMQLDAISFFVMSSRDPAGNSGTDAGQFHFRTTNPLKYAAHIERQMKAT